MSTALQLINAGTGRYIYAIPFLCVKIEINCAIQNVIIFRYRVTVNNRYRDRLIFFFLSEPTYFNLFLEGKK